MAELRYNPFKDDWVMIASHRQKRPQMPKDYCPFCPGSGRVPDEYDVYKYDNDFPALRQDPLPPDDVSSDFFAVRPSYGKCEVILYSPRHTVTLPQLTNAHVAKLVELWAQRTSAIAEDPRIQYVFIFENRGELVGVTMPHPHGQIYGYSYIPKKLEVELNAAKSYHDAHNHCLYCDWLTAEQKDGRRIIFESAHMLCVLPFCTETVYGIQLIPKRHVQYISELSTEEKEDFAATVRQATGTLDCLFEKPMPYMMYVHQGPVNSLDASAFYHLHIEFVPVLRSETVQQFFASSETGAWAHCNPTAPEEKAAELRAAFQKFVSEQVQP